MLRFTLLSTFFLCAYDLPALVGFTTRCSWTTIVKLFPTGVQQKIYFQCFPTDVSAGATLPFVPHFDERIVGGEPATIEEFPYHVNIIVYDQYICGGSIISQSIIVSAAHCTDFPVSKYKIRAGSSFPSSGGQIAYVAKIINHEDHEKPTDKNNDISLIFLTTELTYGPTVAPITLPAQGQHVAVDSMVVAIGWGRLSEGGDLPIQLQKVSIPIINQQLCIDSYATTDLPPVTDNMICAGNFNNGGQDSCHRDSGGSLTVDNVLIGITSWGQGCARPGFPGVWTRVPNYVTWINNNIN